MPRSGRTLSSLCGVFRALHDRFFGTGLLRSEQGSELVEFALAFMILMYLVLGIASFSIALSSTQMVAHVAQEGARYAAARGADRSTPCSSTVVYACVAAASDVQNYVYRLEVGPVSNSNTTVTTTWPGTTPRCNSSCSACVPTNSRGCYVKVAVTYSFNNALPFLPKSFSNFQTASLQVIQ